MSRNSWLAAGAYLILAVAVGGTALFGDRSLAGDAVIDRDPAWRNGPAPPPAPFADDTPACLDYPSALLFARGLHAGRIDDWNPHVGLGRPLWAEQGGALFPLKLVFYAWPTPRTYDLYRVLRLVLGAQGAFLLARSLGRSGMAAFAAGAFFEMSGALAAMLPFGNTSAAFMLPWLVLAARNVALRPDRRRAAALSVALALTCASGHPGVTLIAIGGAGACWLAEAMGRDRRSRAAGWAAAGVLLGLAIAAPAVTPLVELRSHAVSYKETSEAGAIRAHQRRQVRRFVATSMAAPAALAREGSDATRGAMPWLLGPSVGLMGLGLGLAGISRLARGAWAVLALGVIVTLAPPGTAWIAEAPGLVLVLPWYGFALVALPLTQAAAAALDAMRDGSIRAAATCLVLAGSGAIVVAPGPWRLLGLLPIAAALLVAFARGRFVVHAVIAAAIAELALLPALSPRSARARALAATPPLASALRAEQAASHGRMAAEGLNAQPETATLFGIDDVRTVAALPLARTRAYMNLIDRQHGTYTLLHEPGAPLLDAAAVTTWIGTDGPPPGWPVLAMTPHAGAYLNPAAMARTRVVHEAVSAAGPDDALSELATMAGDRDALARRVVIEGSPTQVGEPHPDDHAAIVADDDPDRLVVVTRARTAGLLVVADAFHPGWRATVDGATAPLLAANVAFRAVPVPAGVHRVEMRHAPTSRRPSLAACALGAATCAAWAFGLGRSDRPGPSGASPPGRSRA